MPNQNKKEILILTYYWPPAGGGGVQRWFHFAKNLKRMGYEPIVITVNEHEASYPLRDELLCKEVENIETIRTSTFELLKLYSKIKSGNSNAAIPYGGLEKKKSLFTWASAWIRGNIFLPDARIGWNKYALKAAIKLIQTRNISTVITTGPPHSTHLIGLALKEKFTQIQWIADFRDPWTELYINETLPQTNWAKQKNAALELSVLQTADKVITVGNEMAKLLAQKIQKKEKVNVIYNGFEESLFTNKTPQQTKIFTLLHVGLLGEKQDITPIAEAVKGLLIKNPTFNLVFQIIGKIAPQQALVWSQICPNIKLELLGYLTQQETIHKLFNANILINITPETAHEQIMVSTKTMEYLRTGIPILVISNRGLEFDYLFQNQAFLQVFKRKGEQEKMTLFLEKIYTLWERKEIPKVDLDVQKYAREESAKKLIEIIES